MGTLPPVVFEVSFVVPVEMRWALRAKSVIEAWLMSDAASERPVGDLPAADLQMQVDIAELKLGWLELEASSAWEAVERASRIAAEILPELLRTRTLRVAATLQGPDPDLRRPLDT